MMFSNEVADRYFLNVRKKLPNAFFWVMDHVWVVTSGDGADLSISRELGM
jgi:hypothetical protein